MYTPDLTAGPGMIITYVSCLFLVFGFLLFCLEQAGFAMLEVGSVSIKNTKNILIKV